MQTQTVFKRYELKYLLSKKQKEAILAAMASYMEPDKFGRTTIRNLYFDTDSYRLIRRSIEKPAYKEKLRLRSYGKADPESPVFVELKKKYESVVYKRRIELPENTAMAWLCDGDSGGIDTQISREIDYFLSFYGSLRPTAFLSYDREAYFSLDGADLRVTFDENILFRQEALSLRENVWGTQLLPDDAVLMEIKCAGGIPLWLTGALTREKIYKTSFSKYGTAYQKIMISNNRGNEMYV